MGHEKKPNLASIQEFGATAYVKDLMAGKLDKQAKKGCFMVYDSKSKGYRIYWPEKQSITVEQNVVFNQDDIHTSDETAFIHGEAQSEEKRDKIIQAPQNNTKNVQGAKKPEDEEPVDQQTHKKKLEPH